MARGWESKSVESQQNDALSASPPRRDLTPEEKARVQRRALLELTIANAEAELAAAGHAVHREMLRLKLDALKAELGTL